MQQPLLGDAQSLTIWRLSTSPQGHEGLPGGQGDQGCILCSEWRAGVPGNDSVLGGVWLQVAFLKQISDLCLGDADVSLAQEML